MICENCGRTMHEDGFAMGPDGCQQAYHCMGCDNTMILDVPCDDDDDASTPGDD